MAKSVLVIDTPETCKECALVRGKTCPVLGGADLSPCKALGKRHSDCPLIPLNEFYGRRLKEWTELLNS